MGKDQDFFMFIKSGHVMFIFSCVVYLCLKAFGEKRENKTHEKIGILQYTLSYLVYL